MRVCVCVCMCVYVFVFVYMCAALVVEHAMLYYTVSCDLCGSTILLHVIVQMARFPEKRFTEHKMCVLWFSLQHLSKIFLTLRRIQRDNIIKKHWSSCKYQLFLSDFNETWIFSSDLRKLFRYKISCESVKWDQSHSTRTDRPTNMNLIVAFRNCAKAPKN
jgi:hypothetical protein